MCRLHAASSTSSRSAGFLSYARTRSHISNLGSALKFEFHYPIKTCSRSPSSVTLSPNHHALSLNRQMVLSFSRTTLTPHNAVHLTQPTFPDALILQVFLQFLHIAASGSKWERERKVSIAVGSIFRFGTRCGRSGGGWGMGRWDSRYEMHMSLMLGDMVCEKQDTIVRK